jgi:hypothetical protein
MIDSKIYYLLEEHDGPSSESYLLKSASFDIKTCQFDTPTQLPHPSILGKILFIIFFLLYKNY